MVITISANRKEEYGSSSEIKKIVNILDRIAKINLSRKLGLIIVKIEQLKFEFELTWMEYSTQCFFVKQE